MAPMHTSKAGGAGKLVGELAWDLEPFQIANNGRRWT